MDLSKRRPSPNRSLVFPDLNPSDSQKRMGSAAFDESDENSQPSLREFTARWEEPPCEPPPTKHFMSATVSSASKKKILSERNQEASPPNTPRPRVRSGDCRLLVSSASPSDARPYDPVTNYLSPRPQFLRYDPNRRREFVHRMESAVSVVDELSSTSASSSEGVTQEFADDGSDSEDGGGVEDEVEEERSRCSTVVCKLLLLLGAMLFSACCISSMNYPAAHYLQESGGFLENHPMMGNHSMFYENSLESLVGSNEICLIVHPRDLVSQEEAIEYESLVLDDLIKGRESEGNESESGDLMIPDELAGGVDVEEGQFNDDIGLVTGDEQNVLEEKESHEISDSTLGDSAADELLIPDKLVEWVGTDDSATVDSPNPDKLADSVDIEEDGLNGETGLVTGNEKIILLNGSLGSNLSRDEKDNEEAVECHEFLVEEQYARANSSTAADDIVSNERLEIVAESSSQVPQTNIVSDTPSTAEIKETTESSTDFDFEVKWEPSHIWICSLSAVLGLLTALYKYFTRSRQSALLESSSCSDPTVEGKTSAVLMNGDTESKGHNQGFSDVEATMLETRYQDLERRVAEILRTPVPSGHSSDEREELYGTRLPTVEVLTTPVLSRHSRDVHEGLYASRPPTVELIGEFSFVDVKTSQTGSGQTERSGSKGSPLHQYESKGSKRKSPSSSANKVLPSSPVESVSNGSFSARNKSLRKEDTSDRKKTVAITTTTPLRRSGRLRSRVNSP